MIVDPHRDLLCYLSEVPGAGPFDGAGIGCALPLLRQGEVGLQVLAIYTP